MTPSKTSLRMCLVFACLWSALPAQNISVEIAYSTSTTSSLIHTVPNFSSQDEDVVSYRYDVDTTGLISGAVASLLRDGSAFSSIDDISGLSLIADSSSYYVTTSTSSVWGTLDVEPDDIALYDPLTDTAITFWEGDNYSQSGFIIDALHVYANGSFLLSTSASETIYGLSIRDGDIALINPATSSASIFFNEDLFGGAADINAITIERNTGNLVFSTSSSQALAGVSFSDGDLVMWDGTTASIVFKNNDHFSAGEDINALGAFAMSMPVPEPSSALFFLGSGSFLLLRRSRQS